MRKTRLAEHRDDLHSMSANSAVTLMKEAVDSAIKHGDIRLDAVCSMQSTLALRIRYYCLALCRWQKPLACPGSICESGLTPGALYQSLSPGELSYSLGHAGSRIHSGTQSWPAGCSACKAVQSKSRAITRARPRHPQVTIAILLLAPLSPSPPGPGAPHSICHAQTRPHGAAPCMGPRRRRDCKSSSWICSSWRYPAAPHR